MSVLPNFLSAISIPEATDAGFSKREWIQGTFQELSGKGVEVTSRQPVGEATMVFGPAASRTSLIAMGIPHPAQAL